MIIVPELKTVVILIPRTGSGSLSRAVLSRYPKAFMPYRHMEAAGTPVGYRDWNKVAVVREPLDRIWSLYKYVKQLVEGGFRYPVLPTIYESLKRSVEVSFQEYLLNNETVFPVPYRCVSTGQLDPIRAMTYAFPENKKSQHLYIDPATEVFDYRSMKLLWDRLDLSRVPRENYTEVSLPPSLEESATKEHLERYFSWDTRITS